MALIVSLLVLLVYASSVLSLKASTVHHGDIYIEPCSDPSCFPGPDQVTGTLMVYFHVDNDMNTQLQYKPVCSHQYRRVFTDDQYHDISSTAICNMLGYKEGKMFLKNSAPHLEPTFPSYQDGEYSVSHVDCTSGSPGHLLRCSHVVRESCLEGPLRLTCSQRLTSKQNLLLYTTVEGSLQLCPPDQTINSSKFPNAQISMGLVSIYHNGYYGTINEQPNTLRFGRYEADSICRQLGFTAAVYENTRTVGSYQGQYTFDTCFHQTGSSLDSKVWLTTSAAAKCSQNSCPCFSSCVESLTECLPPSPQPYSECPQGYCCQENNIVIECTYDTSEPKSTPSAGTNIEVCSAHTTLCLQGATQGYSLAEVLAPVLSLLLVVVLVAMGFAMYKLKRRGQPGYVPINGHDGDQPQAGQQHQGGQPQGGQQNGQQH